MFPDYYTWLNCSIEIKRIQLILHLSWPTTFYVIPVIMSHLPSVRLRNDYMSNGHKRITFKNTRKHGTSNLQCGKVFCKHIWTGTFKDFVLFCEHLLILIFFLKKSLKWKMDTSPSMANVNF